MTSNLSLNIFFPFATGQSSDYEAKIFVEVAVQMIEIAEHELKFGKHTLEAILETGNDDNDLNSIANWHFQKAIERYQQAITNLEQARKFKVSAKYLKYIELKMNKCLGKIKVIFTQKLQTEILMTN